MIALLLLLASLSAGGQDAPLTLQERIKAAFLYKFAGFVEWPPEAFPSPEAPIVIGIAAADGLARELEQAVSGRQVGQRPLRVHRLKPGGSLDDCCQILFVGAGNDARRARELLAQARGHPVLTVTDLATPHPSDSVINFLQVDDRMRFDISREAAERNGLQLRAQLLAVARQIVSP